MGILGLAYKGFEFLVKLFIIALILNVSLVGFYLVWQIFFT